MYGIVLAMVNGNSREDSTGGNHAQYIGIGFTLLSILAIPAALGFFLDRLLNTLPLFLLLGLGIGFIAEMYYVYLILQRTGGQ